MLFIKKTNNQVIFITTRKIFDEEELVEHDLNLKYQLPILVEFSKKCLKKC